MNILLTNATEFYSGGELFVFELAKELASRGHYVVVSTQPGHLLQQKCEEVQIKTEPVVYGESIKYMKTISYLRSIIKKHSIDLVHSNTNFDRTYAGFAARWCGIPHVANIHSQHSIQHNFIHWLRNKYAIDYFLVDGEPTKNILLNENKINPDKVSILHLGVDVSELRRDEQSRKKIRERFYIPDDAIVVGNVGHLVPFKGHTYLIDAANEIIKEDKKVHFMIIGDGVLQNQLHQQVNKLNIESNVHFLGFQDDLASFYPAMDIYVQPSLDYGGESFPLAVIQALASGLPVVASNVGDIPLMLNDEQNGLLSKPGDALDLKDKLVRLIRNRDERNEKGKNAFDYVRAHFTIARMTDHVEEVYDLVHKKFQ